MRDVEAYIQRNESRVETDILSGVGELSTLEEISTLVYHPEEKYDVTNALEGDDGGISNFHLNMDEKDQSKFEAGDISVNLSLLATEFKIWKRLQYPEKGHFWDKLQGNKLWHMFNTMTIEESAVIGVRYDFAYYNRKYNFAFIGVIDVGTVVIDEAAGIVRFTAYSFLKRLENIPVSQITRAIAVSDVVSHRWYEHQTHYLALVLLWTELQRNTEMQSWHLAPRFELDPNFTTNVRGFTFNLYSELYPHGLGTDTVYDFTLVGPATLQINVGNDNDICVQMTPTATGYDLSYDSVATAGSKEMAHAQPWYLWERQTSLYASPANIDQVPRVPPSAYMTSNRVWITTVLVSLTGTSYLFGIKKGAGLYDELFRAAFTGYVVSGGGYDASYGAITAQNAIGAYEDMRGIAVVYAIPITVYIATKVAVVQLEWGDGAVSDVILETSDEEVEYGGLFYFRNTNKLLIVETTSGGGFSGLIILKPITNEVLGRRSGQIPADDRTSDYNLDWEDIDFSKMFEISYNRDPDTEAETAFVGITKRSPIRFFVLNAELSKCLLYTNIEQAVGYDLGGKADITRRYNWEDITIDDPDGGSHIETFYYNEVWGLIGDGNIGSSIIFSYNLGNSSQIRILNLDKMTAAAAFGELARCSGAVLFDDAIVTSDLGDGLVTIQPRLNVISRSYLGNPTMDAREWYIDREWKDWTNNVQWKHFFPIIDITFQGGKTQLAIKSAALGDIKKFYGMPKGSVSYRFIFDRHFARIRASGILSYYSAKRQRWAITMKAELFESGGQMVRLNDMIYIRHTAEPTGFPEKGRVISVDYDLSENIVRVVCLTEGSGFESSGRIGGLLPNTPGIQQITGGGGAAS